MGVNIPLLRDLDGSESSFSGLDRCQPWICVSAPKLSVIVPAPALDSISADDCTGLSPHTGNLDCPGQIADGNGSKPFGEVAFPFGR